jgi:hypothetical protein
MPILGILASAITGNLVTNSYESIATSTVGSGGSATITFSSIPATYTHLQIRAIGRTTTANTGVDNVFVRVNSDSGTNYARHQIVGNGSTASATSASSTNEAVLGDIARNNNTSGMFGAFVIDILDYANTSKNKTFRAISGSDLNGSGEMRFRSSLWINTNAISTITLIPENNNFAEHSQFALYGIKGV